MNAANMYPDILSIQPDSAPDLIEKILEKNWQEVSSSDLTFTKKSLTLS